MTSSSSDAPWLGQGDAPVDRDVWCYVPTGQSLLTRRANTCDGRDLMVSHGHGRRRRTIRVGRYVQHHAYATALSTGQHGENTNIAAALDAVGVAVTDLTALTLCAPASLAAALAARLGRVSPSEWQAAAVRAVATGSDPTSITPRQRLLTALTSPAAPHTASVYERWLTLPEHRAVLYASAGLTWTEAAVWERDCRWQHDLPSLATLAALRLAAA